MIAISGTLKRAAVAAFALAFAASALAAVGVNKSFSPNSVVAGSNRKGERSIMLDQIRGTGIMRSSWRKVIKIAPVVVFLTAIGASTASANSIQALMTINGATVVDETRTGSSISARYSSTVNNVTGSMDLRAFRGGDVGAKATVAGSTTSTAKAIAKSSSSYDLKRPATGAQIAGGQVIVSLVLSGEVSGNATLELKVDAVLFTNEGEARAETSRTLVGQPGREQVAFDLALPLPANLGTTGRIYVDPALSLSAVATITPANGQVQTSTADALDSGKVVGFRVRNAAGVQVPGFTLSGDGKNVPELAPPPVGRATAVEYYNAAFAHYFITANADEIGKLDAGIIAGWQRTGLAFDVYTTAAPGAVAVCRFFSASFAPKSSHFYAPRGFGCEAVLGSTVWQFEGDVFFTALPDASGACPAGNVPVYRLYNNGQGGAPNHRFTISEAVQLDMIAEGYIPEGAGTGVGMCSPN